MCWVRTPQQTEPHRTRTEHEPNIGSDCSVRFVFARIRTWSLVGSPNVRFGSVRFAVVRFGEPPLGGMAWRAREWWYGHVSLIEVGEDTPAGVCVDHLSMVAVVVAEIWGERSPPQWKVPPKGKDRGLWIVIEESYDYGKLVSVRKDIYVNFHMLSLIRLGIWVMEIQPLLELNAGMS